MHSEVQVALKFVISFLYNKLPRRRVNLFGEELDNALKDKFQGHWYPDQPFKGSAYRCLKITDPSDPVLNRAARESGNPLSDIIENLPADLAIWIDPGEVSYRMGEKGSVKILYSEKESSLNMEDINPEVRSFLSLESVTASLNSMSVSQNNYQSGGVPTPAPSAAALPSPMSGSMNGAMNGAMSGALNGAMSGGMNGVMNGAISGSMSGSMSGNVSPSLMIPAPPAAPSAPMMNYQQAPYQSRQPPVVYTAASFAQTKFGSTKLKTNSKKPNRMSPTEFSNYIKQRAMQKSMQQHHGGNGQFDPSPGNHSPVSPSGSSHQGYQDRYQNTGGYFSYGSTNSNYNNCNNYQKFFNNSSMPNNSNDYLWSSGGSRSSSVGSHLSPGGTLSSGGNNTISSMGNQNNLSPSPVGLNLSDYSSLFTDWDNELETNAFLQDILASTGVGAGGQKHLKTGSTGAPGQDRTELEDWFSGTQTNNQIGFNSNQEWNIQIHFLTIFCYIFNLYQLKISLTCNLITLLK